MSLGVCTLPAVEKIGIEKRTKGASLSTYPIMYSGVLINHGLSRVGANFRGSGRARVSAPNGWAASGRVGKRYSKHLAKPNGLAPQDSENLPTRAHKGRIIALEKPSYTVVILEYQSKSQPTDAPLVVVINGHHTSSHESAGPRKRHRNPQTTARNSRQSLYLDSGYLVGDKQ